VSCLSTCIFPEHVSYPMNETMIHKYVCASAYAVLTRVCWCLNTAALACRRTFTYQPVFSRGSGLPFPSHLGYGYAKRLLDVQSRLFRAEQQRSYVCVVPVCAPSRLLRSHACLESPRRCYGSSLTPRNSRQTNIYGRNDNFCLEDGHVLPGLIHKCFLVRTGYRTVLAPCVLY